MIYFWVAGKYLQLDAAFASCVVAFMMFEAAYFSEVVRAGIKSIGNGQINTAKALGMTYSQTMRLVILPQAFRKMLPLILQQCIILFQDTTLVFCHWLDGLLPCSLCTGRADGYTDPLYFRCRCRLLYHQPQCLYRRTAGTKTFKILK